MANEGLNSYLESDGKSVTATLTAAVAKDQVMVVGNTNYWVGIAAADGEIGDQVAMSVDRREYQFTVPVGLGVQFGDDVCIDLAQVTGHTPDVGAYARNTYSGAYRRLFKATMNQLGQTVTGVLYPPVP